MATAYLSGSYASQSTTTAADPETMSYDSGGAAAGRALATVCIYEKDTVPQNVSSVTYNSALMLQSQNTAATGQFEEVGKLFTLLSPDTGANTLSAALDDAGQDFAFINMVFTGVASIGNSIANTIAGSSQLSGSISVSDGSIIAWVGSRDLSGGIGTGVVSGSTHLDSFETAAGSAGFSVVAGYHGPVVGAGSVTVGSTDTNAQEGLLFAVEFKASAGGGGTILPFVAQNYYG